MEGRFGEMRSFSAKVALAGIALCVGLLALAAQSRSTTRMRAGAEDALAEIPADQWLGGPAGGLSGAALRGKPVLVEFWTYLCYNCKNVEGWMKETHATYAREGLQVIGVHTPEFEVERKVENVRDYVRKNGIAWPVAIDNGQKVWRKYNATNAWPAFLVFDRQGKLIYRQAGERAVLGAEEAIRKALDEKPAQSAASGSHSGMRVTTSASRESAQSAVLTVAFEPASGYLLVKSPPNEVRLDPVEGVTAPPSPVLLGDPFRGANAGDVSYFEGGASVRVPLALDPSLHGRPVMLSGSVVYHVCDATTKVCARQMKAFRQELAPA